MSKSGKKAIDDDEVEQLLRAAQDDMLLKLSINSHMARASASAAIDPDLDRRFEALKKPTKPAGSVKRPPKEADTGGGSKATGASAEGDDLLARFAALKNTIPTQSNNFPRDGSGVTEEEEEEEDEDEVEKLIRWAKDAARLDPSPPSDDDDHNPSDDDDDHSQDSDFDDDDGFGRGRKSKRK